MKYLHKIPALSHLMFGGAIAVITYCLSLQLTLWIQGG